MLEYEAKGRMLQKSSVGNSVTFWPTSCARSCLQCFAAGYAIRDAGALELPGLRTDQ
jgi:hypothetical protein